MIIDTAKLQRDEQVFLELQQLYEKSGYRQFRMSKFEEYSLYLENKSFLGSESVITFNAPSGKLLALKPDVTLSIVKNAKAAGKSEEKLYYRESVYRLGDGKEFKEISQMGLERIGDIDLDCTLDVCSLAMKSLAVVDEDYVFAVSDMAFIGGLLDDCGVNGEVAKGKILACFRSKNVHELRALCVEEGISDTNVEKLAAVVGAPTDFPSALAVAKSVALGENAKAAVKGFAALFEAVKNTSEADKIRLDFSILNDMDYYNGIIFQGFVKKMPKMLLSGGRYDKLLAKFKKKTGAMGFALSLSDVAAYYPKEKI